MQVHGFIELLAALFNFSPETDMKNIDAQEKAQVEFFLGFGPRRGEGGGKPPSAYARFKASNNPEQNDFKRFLFENDQEELAQMIEAVRKQPTSSQKKFADLMNQFGVVYPKKTSASFGESFKHQVASGIQSQKALLSRRETAEPQIVRESNPNSTKPVHQIVQFTEKLQKIVRNDVVQEVQQEQENTRLKKLTSWLERTWKSFSQSRRVEITSVDEGQSPEPEMVVLPKGSSVQQQVVSVESSQSESESHPVVKVATENSRSPKRGVVSPQKHRQVVVAQNLQQPAAQKNTELQEVPVVSGETAGPERPVQSGFLEKIEAATIKRPTGLLAALQGNTQQALKKFVPLTEIFEKAGIILPPQSSKGGALDLLSQDYNKTSAFLRDNFLNQKILKPCKEGLGQLFEGVDLESEIIRYAFPAYLGAHRPLSAEAHQFVTDVVKSMRGHYLSDFVNGVPMDPENLILKSIAQTINIALDKILVTAKLKMTSINKIDIKSFTSLSLSEAFPSNDLISQKLREILNKQLKIAFIVYMNDPKIKLPVTGKTAKKTAKETSENESKLDFEEAFYKFFPAIFELAQHMALPVREHLPLPHREKPADAPQPTTTSAPVVTEAATGKASETEAPRKNLFASIRDGLQLKKTTPVVTETATGKAPETEAPRPFAAAINAGVFNLRKAEKSKALVVTDTTKEEPKKPAFLASINKGAEGFVLRKTAAPQPTTTSAPVVTETATGKAPETEAPRKNLFASINAGGFKLKKTEEPKAPVLTEPVKAETTQPTVVVATKVVVPDESENTNFLGILSNLFDAIYNTLVGEGTLFPTPETLGRIANTKVEELLKNVHDTPQLAERFSLKGRRLIIIGRYMKERITGLQNEFSQMLRVRKKLLELKTPASIFNELTNGASAYNVFTRKFELEILNPIGDDRRSKQEITATQADVLLALPFLWASAKNLRDNMIAFEARTQEAARIRAERQARFGAFKDGDLSGVILRGPETGDKRPREFSISALEEQQRQKAQGIPQTPDHAAKRLRTDGETVAKPTIAKLRPSILKKPMAPRPQAPLASNTTPEHVRKQREMKARMAAAATMTAAVTTEETTVQNPKTPGPVAFDTTGLTEALSQKGTGSKKSTHKASLHKQSPSTVAAKHSSPLAEMSQARESLVDSDKNALALAQPEGNVEGDDTQAGDVSGESRVEVNTARIIAGVRDLVQENGMTATVTQLVRSAIDAVDRILLAGPDVVARPHQVDPVLSQNHRGVTPSSLDLLSPIRPDDVLSDANTPVTPAQTGAHEPDVIMVVHDTDAGLTLPPEIKRTHIVTPAQAGVHESLAKQGRAIRLEAIPEEDSNQKDTDDSQHNETSSTAESWESFVEAPNPSDDTESVMDTTVNVGDRRGLKDFFATGENIVIEDVANLLLNCSFVIHSPEQEATAASAVGSSKGGGTSSQQKSVGQERNSGMFTHFLMYLKSQIPHTEEEGASLGTSSTADVSSGDENESIPRGPVGKYFNKISDIVKAGTPSEGTPLGVPSSSRMFGTPVGNRVFSLPASKPPTSLVMTTPSRKKVASRTDTPALGRHGGIGVHPSTPHKGGVETNSMKTPPSSHYRRAPRSLRGSADPIHEGPIVVPGVR